VNAEVAEAERALIDLAIKFERKKIDDLKVWLFVGDFPGAWWLTLVTSQQSLSDLIEAHLTFFARGLELMSSAHRSLAQISPEIDLKAVLELRGTTVGLAGVGDGRAQLVSQRAFHSQPTKRPL
jgi:hypothetical protein